MSDLEEQIDRILLFHRRGTRRFDATIKNLQYLHAQLSESEGSRFFKHLYSLFLEELEANRWQVKAESEVVSIAGVIVWSFANFGPFGKFVERAFGILPFDDQAKTGFCSSFLRELRSRISVLWQTVPQDVLDRTKAECVGITRRTDEWLPGEVVEAFQELDKAVEDVEFSRFEEKLKAAARESSAEADSRKHSSAKPDLPAEVAAAVDKAADYLRQDGAFEPKIAADLLRSSIDVAHRYIVERLQSSTGKTFAGPDKDGARRAFLSEIDFISKAEETLFSAIYSFLSSEASHKLIAPKETILLLEDFVRGYLLLLSRRLQSVPVRTPASAGP